MVPRSMTLSDRISRLRHFLKSNIGITARLENKVSIAKQETIPNVWNGTMIGDLGHL